MPFGLRFKKTRRYDISTKNVFMVEVQMLDNTFLECTLSSDSTGHECLDGISQKIELQEVQYFGLRYVTKKLQLRWVDLNKPVKKQLEKYQQTSHASRSPRLYFGVMFYIASAHKIIDDVARYQYYLQMKNDIVDGRLPLTVDQVIRLAALSLQVEFSDYESDRPPLDYFTDNMVFPKNLMCNENIQSELKNEVLQAYRNLQGVHPVKAEIQYMKEIQMLDCYGMEYYTAKDERSKELYLGTCYVGISARYLDGQPPIFYKWTEIARLPQSKKTFEIDTSKSSVQYTMEDSDTAKYLKRMCLLQQKFYKSSKAMLSASLSDVTDFADADILPDIQQNILPQTDIPADQLTQSQTSLQSLKYSDHQNYSQDSRSASMATDEYYNRSQQSLNISGQDLSSTNQPDLHPERRSSTSSQQYNQYHQQQQQQQQQQYAVDNTASDPTQDPSYANRLAALPSYRHTPDYASVMSQRMQQQQQQQQQQQPHHHHHQQQQQQQLHTSNQQIHTMHTSNHQIPDMVPNIANTHIYAQSEEGLAYSQPEIGTGHGHTISGYTHEGQYPHPMSVYPNMFPEHHEYLQYRVNERQTNLAIQPTYSSPELNTQGLLPDYSTGNFLNVNEEYMYYKPPPPYPRASNSTPDLAAQTGRGALLEGPDLVSRNTLGDSAYASHSKLTQSVENLAETIPEVVQISETTVETETGIAEVNFTAGEMDDGSSDHSNSTFHIKETDSETEETFIRSVPQRKSSKVLVRKVDSSKAPPPSTSKDVATRRESFRRMMIARTGSFTPGVLRENSKRTANNNRSLREKEKSSIEEHIQEVNRPYAKVQQEVEVSRNIQDTGDRIPQTVNSSADGQVKHPKTSSSSSYSEHTCDQINVFYSDMDSSEVVSPGREVVRSQSDANKPNNKVAIVHEKAISLDSSSERQQILERLKLSESEVPSTIREAEKSERTGDEELEYEDSDSDQEELPSPHMGPLKMAAMNGLAMSRPMVLALMNDETRAPKDERRRLLEKKLSENLVFKEFEDTPKKLADMDCNVARLPENTLRNRFRDVLPYDASRVKLNPRKDNSSGYINASHIKLSVGNRVWWYIATQAPMDNTPADFWQMIWEQEVEVIAMLTALAELGRPKCYPYWPQEPGADTKLIFGDYQVTLLFTNDSLCYITNRISVLHVPTKKERQIWHLQYTDWPDHGCPDDMYGFLGFLDEIESVQRLAESEEGSGKKSPIVIHCSAGVGRTGVVILTQVMKWCLEHNHEIDLPNALRMIRQQRMYMVQTLGQYNFIHKTLIQYLKNTRLI